MSKPLCIYHGKCADGYTAAWVVHSLFGDQFDYQPGIYGQPAPDVTGRNVVMVDFSYKRPVLEELAVKASSILILDHHKTAAEDLAGWTAAPQFGTWRAAAWDGKLSTNVSVATVFDMERSGAQIAFDYFYPGQKRPPLVDYVGDRDLWRFNLPWSREVNAYVFAHDYTFENWDYLDAKLAEDIKTVAAGGAAIERKHHKDAAELVEVTRRTMRIGGRDMPVANIPYTLASDAGNLMAKHDQGVAACYWDTPAGRTFSLRSTADGPDVSEIAKSYGGGGHKNAAGFQMPLGWEGDKAT